MTNAGSRPDAPRATGVVTLRLPGPLCRRCVRTLSRRLSDVPGVETLAVDAAGGVVRVYGGADDAALAAALPPGGPCRR